MAARCIAIIYAAGSPVKRFSTPFHQITESPPPLVITGPDALLCARPAPVESMLNAALVCLGLLMLLPPAAHAGFVLLALCGREPHPAWIIIYLAAWLSVAALATIFALLELRSWAREEKKRRRRTE